MTDYAYYTQVYLGSRIPEKAFPELARRAGEYLARIRRTCSVTVDGTDSLNMALCAMAETLYDHSRRRSGMTAASLGDVSVRYEGTEASLRSLHRELYEKAAIYLDICRGVAT